MALNGISTLEFKRDRQEAKLALAAADRATAGKPSNLDLSLLPTVYGVDDNSASAIINNAGPLEPGRPWTDGPPDPGPNPVTLGLIVDLDPALSDDQTAGLGDVDSQINRGSLGGTFIRQGAARNIGFIDGPGSLPAYIIIDVSGYLKLAAQPAWTSITIFQVLNITDTIEGNSNAGPARLGPTIDLSTGSDIYHVEGLSATHSIPIVLGEPLVYSSVIDEPNGLVKSAVGEDTIQGAVTWVPVTSGEYWIGSGDSSMTSAFIGHNLIYDRALTDLEVAEVTAWLNVKYSIPVTPFDPATLFSSGEVGMAYDISPDTCWTDSVGGTNAIIGDPVAYITDASGNGNHGSQATLGSRPILRQDGGSRYYLEFDGVDDYLITDSDLLFSTNTTNQYTYSAGAYMASTGGQIFTFNRTGVPSLGLTYPTTDMQFRSRGDLANGALSTPVTFPLTAVVSGKVDRAVSITGRINGVETIDATATASIDFLDDAPEIMGRANLSNMAEGNLYSFVFIDRILTGSELANLEVWTADKTGVTL